MKNIALIIAGGSGNRMGQDIPKQFMHIDGAPIIIQTMKCFQKHPDIDTIAVVCLKGWETVLQSYANQFNITKLKWIFPGGDTGMASIHNGVYGLREAGCGDEDLVLIHDSVRPLLSQEIISSNIAICKAYGYAITGIQCRDDPGRLSSPAVIILGSYHPVQLSSCPVSLNPFSFCRNLGIRS